MPKIGMRMVKTAVAVLLCFVVAYIRQDETNAFYSVVVAILCMQVDVGNSFSAGVERLIGTLSGAALGLLSLLISQWLGLQQTPLLWYLTITLFVILCLYVSVLIKKPGTASISTVQLLSIALAAPGVNPYGYAWLRLTETLVGIVIALVVNAFRLPGYKNKTTLFACAAEHVLFETGGTMAVAEELSLNRMLGQGMQLVLFTKFTPSLLQPSLGNLHLTHPIPVLNGAAVYNLQQKRYEHYSFLPVGAVHKAKHILLAQNATLYQFALEHEQMHVYGTGQRHTLDYDFIERLQQNPENNFVFGNAHTDEVILLYCTLPGANQQEVYNALQKALEPENCRIVLQKNATAPGYEEILIYMHSPGVWQTLHTLQNGQSTTHTVLLDYRDKQPFLPDAQTKIFVSAFEGLAAGYPVEKTIAPHQAQRTLAKYFRKRMP